MVRARARVRAGARGEGRPGVVRVRRQEQVGHLVGIAVGARVRARVRVRVGPGVRGRLGVV